MSVQFQHQYNRDSVQSSNAEKDLLDGVRDSGSAGGFRAAVLVGFWRDSSHPFYFMVDCLSQRLVLANGEKQIEPVVIFGVSPSLGGSLESSS